MLSSATTLLAILSNTLNITLLTSQILTAPAIWERPDGLRTCLRVLGIFHSASVHKLQPHISQSPPGQPILGEGVPKEDWLKAILDGADERSPRWRHLLIIGGLLLGFEGHDRQGLSSSLRRALEGALVKAANLALEETREGPELGGHCVALVLNHSFDLLSDLERCQVNYDALLPVLIRSAYFSSEGLESGYFLGTIDADITQVADRKFNWSASASTFFRLQWLSSRPLVSSMGPLSRLIAHAAENVGDPGLLRAIVDDLCAFTRTIIIQWRQNKLSEIDISEDAVFLTDEALQTTLPVLWKVLKTSMFATVIILRAVMGRVLGDAALASDDSKSDRGLVHLMFILTSYRRSPSCHSSPSHTPQPLLHLLSHGSEFFLAIYFRLSHRHRYPFELPYRVRSVPQGHSTSRARPHSKPSTGTMPGSILPQHCRTFHFSPFPANE